MGGVAKHMDHLHEDLNLTFGELKDILLQVAKGDVEALEKVDGQNVFFSYHPSSGEVRTARNNSDIINNGMSPEEYAAKWAAHPVQAVGDGFMSGFETIQRILGRMSNSGLVNVFGDDANNYVNAEIVYTGNPNLIRYSNDWIVFHNLYPYSNGTPTGIDTQSQFTQLVSTTEDLHRRQDINGWGVSGPRPVQLTDISDGPAYGECIAKLDALNSLGDEATLGDYVGMKVFEIIDQLAIATSRKDALVKRVIGIGLDHDTKDLPDMTTLKKGLTPHVAKQVSQLATKTNAKKIIGKVSSEIEQAISDFAVEVLRGLQSFFVDEHDVEVEQLKVDLIDAQNLIKVATDDKADDRRTMMEKQLAKLGDPHNIGSSLEGIVFEYPAESGRLYKLTGAFAPLNQIVGAAKRIPQGQKESLIRNYVRTVILAG